MQNDVTGFGAFGQHRSAILALVAAGLTLAAAYTAVRQPTYSVRTVLEIGATLSPDGQKWVETPEIVSKKITEAYAPLAWIDARATDPNLSEELPWISGKVARNTNIVVLDTTAEANAIAAHKTFHDQIFASIKDDHDRIFNIGKSSLEAERQSARTTVDQLADQSDLLQALAPINTEISQIEAKLSALEDERQYGVMMKEYQSQIAAADNRLKDLVQAETLLERTRQLTEVQEQQARAKLARLNSDLDGHTKNRRAAAQNAASGSEAMTLMLLDTQKERVAEERDKLDKFLTMDAPIERSRLENQFASGQRGQALQKLAIEKSRAELEKQQIERKQSIATLKPSLVGLKAQLENTKATRQRSLLVETAKLHDFDERLKNMAVTRRLFAPQPPFERADFPASLIVTASAITGLLLGLTYALATHIFGLAKPTSVLAEYLARSPYGSEARAEGREAEETVAAAYVSYGLREPYPMKGPSSKIHGP